MKILFVDDDLNRHRRFKMGHIGCVVVQAFDYADAVRCLEDEGPFDEIYLDHDLSPEAAAGIPQPGEKTGTDIAKYIAAMSKEKVPPKIFVHSYNLKGRTRMAQILLDAGINAVIQPFTA